MTTPPPETQRAVERVGPWRIWFEPPPIPVRSCDWHYQHEETDLDCPSWMNGSAPSREACIAEIIDGYEDRAEQARTALSELQAREAVLIETHTEACDAADHLLAHVTAEVGRYLYDAPDTNLVPMLAETNVTLTGAMWMRLYKATARTALSRTTPTQEA